MPFSVSWAFNVKSNLDMPNLLSYGINLSPWYFQFCYFGILQDKHGIKQRISTHISLYVKFFHQFFKLVVLIFISL